LTRLLQLDNRGLNRMTWIVIREGGSPFPLALEADVNPNAIAGPVLVEPERKRRSVGIRSQPFSQYPRVLGRRPPSLSSSDRARWCERPASLPCRRQRLEVSGRSDVPVALSGDIPVVIGDSTR